MKTFVQGPGIEMAHEQFGISPVVRFLIQATESVTLLGKAIHEEVRKTGSSHLISSTDYYVIAELDREEFDSIIIPMIEAKTIKHVHLDRSTGV